MGAIRGIIKSAALLSGTNTGASLINFVFFIYVLRALGVYGFGIYSLALSAVAFATIFLDLGLGKLIVSDVSRDIKDGKKGEASSLLKCYSLLQIGLGLLIAIGVVLFSAGFSQIFGKDVTGITLFIAGLVLLSGLKNIALTSIQIAADFRSYSWLLLFEAVVKLAIAVLAFTFIGQSVESALVALVAGEALTLGVMAMKMPKDIAGILREKGISFAFFIATFKKHGKWAIAFSQSRNLESNITLWIVEHFLGVASAGVYSALVKLQVLVIRLFEPLETVFFPMVGKLGDFEDSRKTVFRATKYIIYASAVPMILMLLFAGQILGLVLGGGFSAYANAFRILLLTVFIFILNIPMKPLMYGLKAQKSLTFASFGVLASTLFIGSALTMNFGLMGIATNHVVSPAIDLLLKNRFMRKTAPVKYSLREIILPDKNDFDLLKKIISNPRSVLWVKK